VLAPDRIRNQTFPDARRGYDPAAVRAFLERLASELEAAEQRHDRFDLVAEEIAAVLRTAHEEATRTRARAEEAAHQQLDEAALLVAQGRQQATEERDEAKRLLLRAQERSSALTREAEQQAARIVQAAESLARARANNVLGQAQRRLDRLSRDEQQAQQRLRAARDELAALIDRVSNGDRVIDLTPNQPATPAPVEPPRLEPDGEPDPVAAMVRAAVGRAVAGSAE
jgi:DivIVA domain-containing protein